MRIIGVLVCGLALSMAARASAATFELEPVVSAAFDQTFNPIPVEFHVGVPAIYQVDFHVHTTNVAADEWGFGRVVFSIDLVGLTDVLGGFQRLNPMIDWNGAAPGGNIPLFSTPLIPLPGDGLTGIIVEISGPPADANDPRAKVGQPGGVSVIGSVFGEWDGANTTLLVIEDTSFAAAKMDGMFGPFVAVPDNPLNIIPEPATGFLAALGMIALAAWRARTQRREPLASSQ